jgi:hypothetical protein
MPDKPIDSRQPLEAAIPYEPPTVSPLGNVRDLLAGNSGTQPDGSPPDEDFPTIPS